MYWWKLYVHVTLYRCWCPRRIALLSMSSSSRRESWWPRKMSIWPSIPSLLTRMCPTFMWWKRCRWATDWDHISSQTVHCTAGERLWCTWAVDVHLVLTSVSGQCCHSDPKLVVFRSSWWRRGKLWGKIHCNVKYKLVYIKLWFYCSTVWNSLMHIWWLFFFILSNQWSEWTIFRGTIQHHDDTSRTKSSVDKGRLFNVNKFYKSHK